VIPGKIFLKTGHIDEATNKMREVFIYNFEDPTHRKTIYADSGQMGLTADQSTLQMLLHTGYVLQVPRDDPQTLQRLYFTTDLVRVRGVANQFEKTEKDNYKSEREMTVCEMDAQYQQGVHQLEVARQDLATLLANAARFEATGEEPPARTAAPAPSATPGRVTSGSLYCQLISKLFGGVQTAAAAEAPPSAPAPSSSITPAPRQQLIHPPPSKRQRAAAQQTAQQQKKARADSAKARAAQPAGSTKATAGTALVSPTTRYRAAARRVGATAGQIDVIRSRIVDARTSMSTYEVEIQKKFALAAACIVFVIFGAPIALRFPRGGVGLVIGVSMVAFALYYVCLIAGQTLAQKLVLDAFWSMWAANAIFTVIGVVLLIRVQRSGATTRGGDAREVWDAFRARPARQAARLGIARRRRTA
jgi:lipopolysaccharide export system permease protein